MKEISRETAVQLGLKRYFTGVPCKNGHISERYAHSTNNACIACHRLSQQKQRARDPELTRLRDRLYKQKQRARDPFDSNGGSGPPGRRKEPGEPRAENGNG